MKKQTKKALRYGYRSIGRVIGIVLKIIGSVVLILVTTGVLLTLIGALYVNNSLNTDLTVDLSLFTLKQNSTIYYIDKNGNEQKLETLVARENREWVDYKDIPQHMIDALIAVEDKRFLSHKGVDWYRTASAISNLFTDSQNQFGGSTITQQLIKNITLDKDVTVKRKMTEIFRALEFEKNYTKGEILTWYLNTSYFGQGCYGVKMAARVYFNKELSELSLAESASIIGITNSPTKYDPFRNPDKNKERQETILKEMLDQEMLTEAEHRREVARDLPFTPGNKFSERGTQSWYVDQVFRDVSRDLAAKENITYELAQILVLHGGFKIFAAIDMELQAIVDDIFTNEENIPKVRGLEKPQAAMILMEPYTGEVLAMAGGVGEKVGNLNLNRAIQSVRQPGSSMKPIAAYAPAMEYEGVTPNSIIDDSPMRAEKGRAWPRNSGGRYRGLTPVNTALVNSVNTVATRTIDLVTPERAHQFLRENMGVTSLRDADVTYSLALGGLNRGISVLEITAAYSAFVNRGEYIKPRTYTLVTDQKGDVILDGEPQPRTAIAEKNAWYMNTMLENAVRSGTGARAKLAVDMPAAGKTGTTSEDKDRWFVGYTPYYCAGVWFGFDDPKKISLEQSTNPALALWKMVMDRVHADLERREFFTLKDDEVVKAAYCLDSGLKPTDRCRADPRGSRSASGVYYKDDIPTESCDVHALTDRCAESGRQPTPYCPEVVRSALLNFKREMPVSGVVVEDEGYRMRSADGGTSPAGSAEGANTRCPIHTADWVPPEIPGDGENPGEGNNPDDPLTTDPPVVDIPPPDNPLAPPPDDGWLDPQMYAPRLPELTPLPDLNGILSTELWWGG